MNSSAAPSVIRLRYIVETEQAVREVKEVERTITTSTQTTAQAATTAAEKVETAVEDVARAQVKVTEATTAVGQAAETTAARTQPAASGMKQALLGIQPAIGGLSASFAALGQQAPAGVQAVTGALATMLTAGINPIVATAAGVGALGIIGHALFGRDPEVIQRRIDDLRDSIREFEGERTGLGRQQIEAEGGPGVESQAAEARYQLAVSNRIAALVDLRRAEEALAKAREDAMLSRGGGSRGVALENARAEVEQIRQQLEAAQYAERLAQQLAESARRRDMDRVRSSDGYSDAFAMARRSIDLAAVQVGAMRAGSGPGDGRALRGSLSGIPMSDAGEVSAQSMAQLEADFARARTLTENLSAEIMEGLSFGRTGGPAAEREIYSFEEAIRRRADAARQLRAITEDRQESELLLEDQIAEKVRELAEYRRMGAAADEAVIEAREREIELLREALGLEKQRDAEERRRERDRVAPSIDYSSAAITERFSFGIEQATRQGLANALSNPDDLRGALSGFAMALRDSAAQALADALMGLGKEASSGLYATLFQTAASVGSSAAGAPVTTGGATPATSAAAASATRSLVVVNVFDDKAAGQVAAKMSGTDAQVVVTKAGGGGGATRGVIPGRRK